jgi:hypothetical protein
MGLTVSPLVASMPFDSSFSVTAQTALLAGIHRNSREQILAAVEAGADPSAVFPGQHRSPLHWATHLNQEKALAALLEAGAVPQALAPPPDSDGVVDEEAVLLPQLLAFDSSGTKTEVVRAWWEGDPELTAAFPMETKSPEGGRPWVATPLSLLLLGIPEHALYVAPDEFRKDDIERSKPTLKPLRKTIRECLEIMQARPVEWTAETAQAALVAAVGSCSVAILDDEGPLKKMGLDLSMASCPEELLAAIQTVVFAYPDQADRAVQWLRKLAPLGADWNTAMELRGGNTNSELDALKSPYREWSLDARLPAPRRRNGPGPRF